MQQENHPQTLPIVGSEVVAILSQEVKIREEKNQTNYANQDNSEEQSGESSGSRGGAGFRTLNASDRSGMESPRISSTNSLTLWQAASNSLKDRSADSKDSQKVEAAQSKQGLKSHWPSVDQTSLPPSAHLAGAFKRKKVDEGHETPLPKNLIGCLISQKRWLLPLNRKGWRPMRALTKEQGLKGTKNPTKERRKKHRKLPEAPLALQTWGSREDLKTPQHL